LNFIKRGEAIQMYRYAQINEDGDVVSDSYLSGEAKADNMIPLDDGFDLTNKRYVNGTWVDYTPEPIEAELDAQEMVQAQILLNQADIMAKQQEQDEVLAEIILQQAVKQQEQDEVLAAILLNQMEGGGADV